MSAITIKFLQEICSMRSARDWGLGAEQWTIMEWGCAAGGECGEAQNVAKKIRRLDMGVRRDLSPSSDLVAQRAKYVVDLEEELADTVCYLVLWAEHAGIDLQEAVRRKFNSKSEQIGSELRL